MWQKIFILATLCAAVMSLGCNESSVAPTTSISNTNSGRTQFIKYVNPGDSTQFLNQDAIFKDSSDNSQLTGLRDVVINSQSQGNSYGTFSLETDGAHWEGNWTGTTTSSGTTIRATGYDLNERGKSCEWNYYLPSSQNGKAGTFSASIIYERD